VAGTGLGIGRVAVVTTRAEPVTARHRRVDARRLAGRFARSSPGVLMLLGAGLVLVSLLAGVLSAVSVQGRADAVTDLSVRSEPLSIAAQRVYRSLSDADATAASAFLAAGLEPAELRTRYLNDIAQAEDALSVAARESGSSGDVATAVTTLSSRLPVYTGLVETARANNLAGLPVGAAYLQEASGLMRTELLPAAEKVYQAETGQVAADQDRADQFPFVELLLGLLVLAGLVWAQVYLTRRTNRLLNVGLVLGTVAALVSVVWLVVAGLVVAADVSASRDTGSAQVDALARARIATLKARSDETLTLVARGSGQSFEKDYANTAKALGGDDGAGGLLGKARDLATDPAVRAAVDDAITQQRAWSAAHKKVRAADDSGQYTEAVQAATGTAKDGAAVPFNQLDADLVKAIDGVTASFNREVASADGALSGAVAGAVVLAVLTATGAGFGVWQRLKEYR
jgi:hypothetical protein